MRAIRIPFFMAVMPVAIRTCAKGLRRNTRRTSRRRGLSRRLLVPLVVVALVVLSPRNVRADGAATTAAAVYLGIAIVLGLGVVGGDATFTIHDAITAGDPKPAAKSWTLGESLFTAPQSIYYNGALAWVHGSGNIDESPLLNLLILPATWANQMTTHGIWSHSLEMEKPSHLYGMSWAIGANLAFTSGALGGAFGKRLGGTVYGLSEMAGTAPTIIVGLWQLTKDTQPNPGSWTALTVWSSALFLHGATSTVVGLASKKKPAEHEPHKGENAFHFTLAPTVIPDGRRNVPGFVAAGVF